MFTDIMLLFQPNNPNTRCLSWKRRQTHYIVRTKWHGFLLLCSVFYIWLGKHTHKISTIWLPKNVLYNDSSSWCAMKMGEISQPWDNDLELQTTIGYWNREIQSSLEMSHLIVVTPNHTHVWTTLKGLSKLYSTMCM